MNASSSSQAKPIDPAPPSAFPQSAQIDKFIDGIEENLNTFTTEQFEELRQTVKDRGFTAAQSTAPELFNIRRGVVRIKPPRPPGPKDARTHLMPLDSEFEIKCELLRKVEVRDRGQACEGAETIAVCTGFLSAPTLVFGVDSNGGKNRHIATVAENALGPKGRAPAFLLSHLVSARILQSLNRL